MKTIFLFITCLSTYGYASIYPTPRVCELGGEESRMSEITYQQLHSEDLIIENPQQIDEENIGSLLDIKPKEGITLPEVEGAYYLLVTPRQLRVLCYDDAGRFYAKQSLSQIGKKNKSAEPLNRLQDPFPDELAEGIAMQDQLPQGRVIDWPHLNYRGVVENAESLPWTQQQRTQLIKLLGRNKCNTYLHISASAQQVNNDQIRELCKLAASEYVRFIWSFDPSSCLPSKSAEAMIDPRPLCKKLEELYQRGIRHFALSICLDKNQHMTPEQWAQLCLSVQELFFAKYKDLAPLYLNPNSKTKDEDKQMAWLRAFAQVEGVHVRLIWTKSLLSSEQQEEMQNIIGSRPIIFLSAAKDGQKIELDQLPRDQQINKHIAGLLLEVEPSSKDHQERLFDFADYCWNPQNNKSK